jgi:membrane-bound hydrogenase subunit beta
MKAKEMLKKLAAKFKDSMYDVRVENKPCGPGVKKKETTSYWLKVRKEKFKEFVEEMCKLNYPFLAVVSGRDNGQEIELIYHFYVNYGGKLAEEGINVSVMLPKSNPTLPTITDLIPGALITEKEKQEMLGVNIVGIDNDRFFLPKSHPAGNYPWRRDAAGNLQKPI